MVLCRDGKSWPSVLTQSDCSFRLDSLAVQVAATFTSVQCVRLTWLYAPILVLCRCHALQHFVTRITLNYLLYTLPGKNTEEYTISNKSLLS